MLVEILQAMLIQVVRLENPSGTQDGDIKTGLKVPTRGTKSTVGPIGGHTSNKPVHKRIKLHLKLAIFLTITTPLLEG